MVQFISNALAAVAKFFGFQQHRSELRNTEEMRDNAEAQDAEKERAEATKAVAKALDTGNLDEVRKKASGGGLKLLILLVGLSFAVGCASTVRPDAVPSRVIEFDGVHQDAGILGVTEGSPKRFIVAQHVADRFRALAGSRGEDGLVPTGAVSPERGPTWYMDAETMVLYLELVAKARAGR